MAESLADWERDLLERQEAEKSCAAAIRAGQAILDAYDRSILQFPVAYLADTLRMVLDAVSAVHEVHEKAGSSFHVPGGGGG